MESDPAEVQSSKLYVKVKDAETGQEKVEAAPLFKRIPRPKNYPDWLSEEDVRRLATMFPVVVDIILFCTICLPSDTKLTDRCCFYLLFVCVVADLLRETIPPHGHGQCFELVPHA